MLLVSESPRHDLFNMANTQCQSKLQPQGSQFTALTLLLSLPSGQLTPTGHTALLLATFSMVFPISASVSGTFLSSYFAIESLSTRAAGFDCR
jgi:hypothetical protein